MRAAAASFFERKKNRRRMPLKLSFWIDYYTEIKISN